MVILVERIAQPRENHLFLFGFPEAMNFLYSSGFLIINVVDSICVATSGGKRDW